MRHTTRRVAPCPCGPQKKPTRSPLVDDLCDVRAGDANGLAAMGGALDLARHAGTCDRRSADAPPTLRGASRSSPAYKKRERPAR